MNATSDSLKEMADRLSKLERRNRQMGFLLVGLLAVGAVVLLSAAHGAWQSPNETDTLILRDGAGKARARLEIGKQGPVLRFLDERGRAHATLGTRDDAVVLRLFNRNGRFQAGIALERDGIALACYDADGNLQTGRAAVLETGGVFVRP